MGRKETNAKFIAGIDGLNMSILRVACYVNAGNLAPLENMDQVINRLKYRFAEHEDDYVVYSTANEYERIKDYSPNNLQIWANYRRNLNANQPIAKADGEFIRVKAEGIKVTVDGASIVVNDYDFVTVDADYGNGEQMWANVSFGAMEKMVQIKNHWDEIKCLVE